MVERSAADREGVGSTPTSGPHTANPSYAAAQLAKALRTAEQHADADTRERAQQKAQKWAAVFSQMLAGSLQVGSRTPVASVPACGTLEVVTGGFATGELLAGGPLRDHERSLIASHALEADADDRLALNRYFLSEAGLAELTERLERGTYAIDVPEEGALLVVAWLIRGGHRQQARELLDQLAPFMSRLRFYPAPSEHPQRLSSRVFVQDVNTTIDSLRAITPNRAIATQREAIEIWTPLYEELVALFLETVEGTPPQLATGPDGKTRSPVNDSYNVQGGWPCKTFPSDWSGRATDLLQRFERLRQQHRLSANPPRNAEEVGRGSSRTSPRGEHGFNPSKEGRGADNQPILGRHANLRGPRRGKANGFDRGQTSRRADDRARHRGHDEDNLSGQRSLRRLLRGRLRPVRVRPDQKRPAPLRAVSGCWRKRPCGIRLALIVLSKTCRCRT